MGGKWKHRLSNIDEESRTADCAECGRVAVVWHRLWMCSVKRRKDATIWRKANPERYRKKHREWNKANPEKSRANSVRWAKAHPEKKRAIWLATKQKRRARKAGNGGSFTPKQWIELKALYGRCLCCNRGEAELLALGLVLAADHVRSLTDGGSSYISNIQPLCHGIGGCNNHKGKKSIDYRNKKSPDQEQATMACS